MGGSSKKRGKEKELVDMKNCGNCRGEGGGERWKGVWGQMMLEKIYK